MEKVDYRTIYTVLLPFSHSSETMEIVDNLVNLNYNVSYYYDLLIGYVIIPKNDISKGFKLEYAKEIMHILNTYRINCKLIVKQYSMELLSYEEII